MSVVKKNFIMSETKTDTATSEPGECVCGKITGYGNTEDSFRDMFSVVCKHEECFWCGLDHKHCRECGQVASHHAVFARIEKKLETIPKYKVLKHMEDSKLLPLKENKDSLMHDSSDSCSDKLKLGSDTEEYFSVRSSIRSDNNNNKSK